MVVYMPTITLKDIPEDVHAQLKREAAANLRSLNQEALWRLQQSLDAQASRSTSRDQRWVDEALSSGPESPLSFNEMRKIRNKILRKQKRR